MSKQDVTVIKNAQTDVSGVKDLGVASGIDTEYTQINILGTHISINQPKFTKKRN